jgi:excisionase family DNA binding protein
MRLEEWFKHVESFEHGSGQNVGHAGEQIDCDRLSPLQEPIAVAPQSEFGIGDGATFRAAPAPATNPRPVVRKSSAPKGRPMGDAPLPVQRESREQLLARLLDPVLTLEEAAKVLSVCPTTVRRYTNKGVLQHYRTNGNQRRFRLSHVLSFLGDTGDSRDKGTLKQTLHKTGASQADRVHGRRASERRDSY